MTPEEKLKLEQEEAEKKRIEEEEEAKKLEDEKNKKAIEDIIAKERDALKESFEAQLKQQKEEFEKDRALFDKVLEGMKNVEKKDDIIKEIEKNREEQAKAKKDKELLELLEKTKLEKEAAIADKLAYEKRMSEERAQRELELEKERFKTELLKEAKDKPHLANKIEKVLEEDDYELQKTEYRMLKKFFDTPEEEEAYNLKKKAGGSAFKGVKNTNEKGEGLVQFNQAYINKILRK